MLCFIRRKVSVTGVVHVFKRFKSYPRTTMEDMHFRRLEGSDNFDVSFQFKFDTLNVDRQFNFSRKLSESVDSFVERIRTNLDKVLVKKKNRKQKKQDTPEVNELCNNINIEITVNGSLIPQTMKCEEAFFSGSNGNNGIKFSILNHNYKVIINAPWVKSLLLPSSIMAGFPTYPNKIDILFGDKENSKFFWYVASPEQFKRDEWTEVGTGLLYTPSQSDIGCKLKMKCIPSNGETDGAVTEVVTATDIQPGPGPCPFETRHNFTKDKLGEDRVVSYNILADSYAETDYAKKEMFPHCPPHALTLDYRKQLYLKEILGYNADIICLQEVDPKVFEYDLKRVLSCQNMGGLMALKGGTVNEGLATFYNMDKFRLLESHRIILADEVDTSPIYSEIWAKIKDNESLVKNLKDRANVVQVLVFESLGKSGEIVVVGNSHLYFSPYAEHIRLIQGGMYMSFVEHISKIVSEKNFPTRVSVVMCGDFNSSPDCGIYTLMTTGCCPDNVIDWKCQENEVVEGLELKQPYSFESAYGTPEYTNFTVNFAGCLDYIYYQNDRLSLLQAVPLPSDEVVKRNVAMPSVVFPSDHLALVADFGWI